MSAARGGHVETVKLLLSSGAAEVNAVGGMGETALNLAKKAGRGEVVELLRRAGAGEGSGH